MESRSMHAGLTVLLCAVLFRLCAAGWVSRAAEYAQTILPREAETGRNVRPFSFVWHAESPAPLQPMVPAPTMPVFSPEDAEAISVYDPASLCPDVEALLECPLPEWESPAVLILSTHSTESYTQNGEPYVESAAYRTLDEGYNMLSLGERVAARLEERGIRVVRDGTVHDYPSYNGSYSHARKAIAAALEADPGICMVLDLHRDAAGTPDAQMRTQCTVNGQDSAKLMLVVGSNASLKHPNWKDNLALALKLQIQLERCAPGITRPLNLRTQRFNQDLSPGALLVEIGAAGNTRNEALVAADVLAEAIAELLQGG